MSDNHRSLLPEEIADHIRRLSPEALQRLHDLLSRDGYLLTRLSQEEIIQELLQTRERLLESNERLFKSNMNALKHSCEMFFRTCDVWMQILETILSGRKSAARERSQEACAEAIIKLHDGPERLSFGKIPRRLLEMNPAWGDEDGNRKSVDAVKKLYRRHKKKIADREANKPILEIADKMIAFYHQLESEVA